MKFLCIIPHYHADSSANNVCMMIIIDKILGGHTVDILCTDNEKDTVKITNENGCRIISICNEYNKTVSRYGKFYQAKKWSELPKGIRFWKKVKCYIGTLGRVKTDYYAVDALSRRKIITALNTAYDIIISHSHPFAAHSIAKDLMKRKISKKWYAICWDPFVYNKLDPVKWIEKRKKTAQKILNAANGVFMLDGIAQENLRNSFSPLYQQSAKMIVLPTLKDNCMDGILDPERTVLTFAGAFYASIRRPDEMLDILSFLPSNYVVQLVGNGCRGSIQDKRKLFTECELIDRGRLSHVDCLEVIKNSNILINVGNKVTNQLPSKVFEYISFGKPIINFYYDENDLGLKYFSRYPLCFNIKVDNYSQKDIDALLVFCEETKKQFLTYEEATDNMKECRAENVLEEIVSILYRI